MSIEVSAAERHRIQTQGWTDVEGVDPQAMFVVDNGRILLGHQPDGRCVFLDAAGRCRIHAKYGEAIKPLACRAYPLVIQAAGSKFAVSLRFSCPAAAKNQGQPLSEQSAEIRSLVKTLVRRKVAPGPPPAVLREPRLDWEDFLRYITWLDHTFAVAEAPVALKLVRALHWLRAMARAGFDQLAGSGANEILETLVESAAQKLPAWPCAYGPPSRFGRFCLRHYALECARPTTIRDARLSSPYRWRKLWTTLRAVCAVGHLPATAQGGPNVRFSHVEKSYGPLPADVEATLTRFLRVKINGLHFCGPAFYGLPLVEGFYSLAMAFSAILWLSRWRAAAEGRSSLSQTDIIQSLIRLDYHHGHVQGLSVRALRLRVRLLDQRNDIAKLCSWAAR